MIFRLFYSIILSIFSLAVLLRPTKRRPIKTYFGFGIPKLNRSIWIHAVSVGEARAAIPIVKRLKKEYPNRPIVMSSVTLTGHAEVKRSLPEVDHPIYLPLDLPFFMKRAVRRLKPELLVIVETDYWYLLMDAVKRRGGKIVVINGKLSQRSAKFYRGLGRPIMELVDHFCVQDEIYRQRFSVPDDKIEVTGNLKVEAELPSTDTTALRKRLKLSDGDSVITIGSTHDPEEELILRAITSDKKILLVPRHPERFEKVADFLKAEGIRFGRYSEELTGDEQVILIDAMGVLRECYQLSDLAIVAGSFTDRIGGHNILEPLAYGVPVIYGPYMYSQPSFHELVQRYGAGLQAPIEELSQAVDRAFAHKEDLARRGRQLLESSRGSVDRTCAKICRMIG